MATKPTRRSKAVRHKSGPTPSALTRRECARLDWPIIQLEHWLAFAKPDKIGRNGTKRDGWGFDHAALDWKPGTLYIQSTSKANMAARVKKILGTPEAKRAVLLGNRAEVWGWEWRKEGRSAAFPVLHRREVTWPSEG